MKKQLFYQGSSSKFNKNPLLRPCFIKKKLAWGGLPEWEAGFVRIDKNKSGTWGTNDVG